MLRYPHSNYNTPIWHTHTQIEQHLEAYIRYTHTIQHTYYLYMSVIEYQYILRNKRIVGNERAIGIVLM